MRVLVDQDGVLADWGKAWDAALEPYGDGGMFIPRHLDQRSFNLKDGRSPDEVQIINAIMEHPGFYADLEPIDGAITALKEILADGHDVAIVTSPYYSNPTCIADKVEWVRRHLGGKWLSRVILAGDKTRVSGDILIDDKDYITGARVPDWEHVHFTQPYNAHITGQRRLDSWADWRSVVEA